jgi:hypothetical protein
VFDKLAGNARDSIALAGASGLGIVMASCRHCGHDGHPRHQLWSAARQLAHSPRASSASGTWATPQDTVGSPPKATAHFHYRACPKTARRLPGPVNNQLERRDQQTALAAPAAFEHFERRHLDAMTHIVAQNYEKNFSCDAGKVLDRPSQC